MTDSPEPIEQWGSAPGPRAALIVGANDAPCVASMVMGDHGLYEWPAAEQPAERALQSLITATGSHVTLNTEETVELTDPDWEPDYAIISRLRENERQCMARIAALEADNAALVAKLATFGPATPADLPDPPRRADGTLAPVAKPWTPPKAAGDTRRIGG